MASISAPEECPFCSCSPENPLTPECKGFGVGDLVCKPQMTIQAKGNLERFLLYDSAEKLYEKLFGGYSGETRTADFPDDSTKRRVYRLVFDVIHHQLVTEELLIESSFYANNYELYDSKTMLLIALYDFMQHKFILRLPRNETIAMIPPKVVRVSEALWQHKVTLSATLARMRVKANAQTITQLIPNEILKQRYGQSTGQLLYARINFCKVNNVQQEIVSWLQNEGLKFVKSKADVQECKKAAYHFRKNLIAFSSDCRLFLDTHDIVTDGRLVVQDFASYCIVDELENYLKQSADVIITHCNAGIEAFHIATILGSRGKVFVYGTSYEKVHTLEERMLTLGLNNIEFKNGSFVEAEPSDDSLADVTTIVCQPCCSLSAVKSCVDFIMQEGECADMSESTHLDLCELVYLSLSTCTYTVNNIPDEYLPKLLRAASNAEDMEALTATQMECISHALKCNKYNPKSVTSKPIQHCMPIFSHLVEKARQIVHVTRSHQNSENEVVVSKAIDQHGTDTGSKRKFLVPQTFKDEQAGYSVTVIEKVTSKKTTQTAKEPAKDVIARAIAQGILGGSDEIASHKHIKIKKKKGRPSSYTNDRMTIAAQQKVVKKKESSVTKIFH